MEDGGFLPLCPGLPEVPKSTPRRERPKKARATDMDEALSMTQRVKEHVEALTAKQQEAARRLKERRALAMQLNEQMNGINGQLQSALAERELQGKTVAEIQQQTERLQAEHNLLHTTHGRTKSSLDSALAAQEEYRKGCNSLRAALQKAQDDLSKKEAELEVAQKAKIELDKVKATLEEQEFKWMEDIDDTRTTLKKMMSKQNAKSKAVLDRMLAGQGHGLMGCIFQTWVKDWKEEMHAKHMDHELLQAQTALRHHKAKKKDEAKQVLDRMSSASENGLCLMVYQAWFDSTMEARRVKEDADKLTEKLKSQKLEARKALERNLGSSMMGVLAATFHDWSTYFLDQKKEYQMKEAAQKQLRDYQKKKRGEAMSVVQRMTGHKTGALMAETLMCWRIIITEEKTVREFEKMAASRYTQLQDAFEKMKEEYAQKKDDLDDVQEELAETRKKNQAMRTQLKKIMDLEDEMDVGMKDMD
mmetsp:Transcript_36299/g.103756  ORF Transcript_36299/g.103756 Transcript_36299/m.103756 type:complete len:475 (-) Transcript_36299:38-1462(-)